MVTASLVPPYAHLRSLLNATTEPLSLSEGGVVPFLLVPQVHRLVGFDGFDGGQLPEGVELVGVPADHPHIDLAVFALLYGVPTIARRDDLVPLFLQRFDY